MTPSWHEEHVTTSNGNAERNREVQPSGSRQIGVLISGRGSNLQAIIDAISHKSLNADLAVVISNNPNAAGLQLAQRAGIDTLVIDHTIKEKFPTREDYDRALIAALRAHGVRLVCLAGFMRLLTPVFIQAFPNAILNIHPSLLPSFPGINAQYQAWAHGVKYTGATVHMVTEELDAGPIVLQQIVDVMDSDDPEGLAARILQQEHKLYPRAIGLILDGKWRLQGRRLVTA
jgi:phosphoribosylglycinamide formyltransferase-1